MNIDDPKARRRNRHLKRRQHAARKNRADRQQHQRTQVLVLEHPDCGNERQLSFPEMMARKARAIGRSLDQVMRHDIETAREVLHSDDEGFSFA